MTTPLGTNSLNSLGTFFQRQLYKNTAYPDLPSVATSIDIWYKKNLYGRVTEPRDAVFPSEGFLKQIRTETGTVLALNFVVDAFEDFKSFYNQTATRNKIANLEEQTIFPEIQAESGWESVNEFYHSYMEMIYGVFVETFVLGTPRDNKIRDINSFMDIFLKFVDRITPEFPFSRTGFIPTHFCSPEISGMMIKLKTENHSVDQVKFEEFIQDSNFPFYTRAARQFGFKVDENAPWRLICDTASPATTKYLLKNNTTFDTLFEDLFYHSYRLEVDTLKVYILQFYNSFVAANPNIKVLKTTKCGDSIAEVFNRKGILMADLEREFDDNFWLKMLAYIRLREIGKTISQARWNRMMKMVRATNKSLGFDKALDLINVKTRGPSRVIHRNNDESVDKLIVDKIAEDALMSGGDDFSFYEG